MKEPLENYVGRFARPIETGGIVKVIAVDGDMLKVARVNELVRLIMGGSLESRVDYEDIEWFDANDMRFLKVVTSVEPLGITHSTIE